MELIIVIAIIVTSLIIVFIDVKKEDKKRKLAEEIAKAKELERESRRKRLFNKISSFLPKIQIAVIEFEHHLKKENGYFNNSKLIKWLVSNEFLYDNIKDISLENIGLGNDTIKQIRTFILYITDGERIRQNFNKKFIDDELQNYSSLFDNIGGKKLDIQQRTAIVKDEDNNIIIAGAGSGKTLTIVGKVQYVIDRYNINPENILLISFTNKSANDLAQRVNVQNITAKTFHKFGKDTIVHIEKKQPSIFEQAQFEPLIKKYFNELLDNKKHLNLINIFFLDFLKPYKSQEEFNNQGDYFQYMKDQSFRPYKFKEISINGKITYQREVVKSIEEYKIANFLFLNGVEYEYEFPYEYETANKKFRQYKPDFTIRQNGKTIYLEHFGISRNNTVPHWFNGDEKRSATKKYLDGMEWKREIHKKYSTILIETYSYEMSEAILFKNLTNRLHEQGIVLSPKSPEEIFEIIKKNASDEYKSFITLLMTFITLMKSNNYTFDDLKQKNKDIFQKERNSLFIEILEPIFNKYQSYLASRKELDFSDLINKATAYINSGDYNHKFDYVIIDEFQDISIGRYKLVKAIKDQNPECKLFCVGDDWQSIYRFSGSDIALFKNFEDYFGYTEKSKIETTYRFHNPLMELSSNFILKNPNQTNKELKSNSQLEKTNYKIIYSANRDDTLALKSIFDELISNDTNILDKEILILGRYNFDIDRIKNQKRYFRIYKKAETNHINQNNGKKTTYITYKTFSNSITAKFMSIHSAKGLESDIVIILNCNSGKYGFPSEMSDDSVLNMLLSEADQFENGEERRLFYVAMTRAKEEVFFICDEMYKSKFIQELEIEIQESSINKCPICLNADMILRKKRTISNGNKRLFYGCSNYIYGCDYTKTQWINKNPYY